MEPSTSRFNSSKKTAMSKRKSGTRMSLRSESEVVSVPEKKVQMSTDEQLPGRKCLICLEYIPSDYAQKEKSKPPNKRDRVGSVDSVREKLLDAASRRGDERGAEIVDRINTGICTVYHLKCYKLFYLNSTKLISKTPSSRDKIAESMENIYNFLGNAYDCQFSMQDLLNAAGEYQPTIKSIKRHLLEHYGEENVSILYEHNKGTTVSISKTAPRVQMPNNDPILSTRTRTVNERKALVEEVAKIIRGDICTKYYDTTVYPTTDSFPDSAHSDLPETLQLLLQGIIMEEKKGYTSAMMEKCTAIGHAIISATRPRSFNSAILLAVSSYCHRKFTSKTIIRKLSALGFAASYRDIDLLHFSSAAAVHEAASMHLSSFLKFSSNNADFHSDEESSGGKGFILNKGYSVQDSDDDEEMLRLEDI